MKISNSARITLRAAILTGLASHLFALTNVLQNHDNIAVLNGYGAGVTSGRWFLNILGDFIGRVWGNYNLPFFNGLLCILLLSVSAAVITERFRITDLRLCAAWGGVFLAFPSVTSMLFYRYAAPYYALAVLLTVLSVWYTGRGKYGFLTASVLSACAMGIYQAYVPLMASLYILLLLRKILEEDSQILVIVKEGCIYLGTLALSFLEYFIFLKASLFCYHASLSGYQGIDHMGKMTLGEIPVLFKRMYGSFLKLPVENYYGVTETLVLKVSAALLGVFCAAFLICLLLFRKRSIAAGTLALCLLFPAAVNSIILMCPDGNIYTLMIYASVCVFLMPIVLFDKVKDRAPLAGPEGRQAGSKRWMAAAEKGMFLTFACLILNYVWLSNGNYTRMYFTTRQTENYFNSLITEVKGTDQYSPSFKWAFIGKNIEDPLFNNPWGNSFDYGGSQKTLINFYSRDAFIRAYTGCHFLAADESETEALKQDPFIRDMPCYPESGSIAVYKDMIIIKLSNEE